MNTYHFWGVSAEGREQVSANGRRLMPAPAGAGNLWQRYALILLQYEFRVIRPPVNYLLLARYLPAGRPIPSDSLPPLFEPLFVRDHDGNNNEVEDPPVLEITSDDLAAAVARVEVCESQMAAVDDAFLLDTITGPDYRLAGALLNAGVKAGRETLSVLIDAYERYIPEQSPCRREMLRTLLRGGLNPGTVVAGKTLLNHLCSGTSPAQDIRLLLDAGAHEAINMRDEDGETPLLGYCRRQHAPRPNRKGLSLLLDHGADPAISNRGETAYTLLRDNEPLASLLL